MTTPAQLEVLEGIVRAILDLSETLENIVTALDEIDNTLSKLVEIQARP